MDGILNVLKPAGMTSFDVIAYLRGVLRIKRIGHTGTLDPGAVGVLPVCIGRATKAIEYITDRDKLYRAELTLGIETDTQDSFGQVTSVREVNVTNRQIFDTVNRFKGKLNQVPPMYSAVKIGGKKLYELAREGKTIERKPREIEIYSIKVVNLIQEAERDKPYIFKNPQANTLKIIFDVACSKGTYIRTLCFDIGESLGCGGHMSFLVRLKAGNFDIASSITMEEIARLAEEGSLDKKIVTVDEALNDMHKVVLNQDDTKRLLNGVHVQLRDYQSEAGKIVRVYNEHRIFVALAEVMLKGESLLIKSKKVF